ncbi:MAG TPA: protease pro-enzyme activation domain-containing protein, partial [Acidimicrobiales bacterium]|nr:protease pro-enzyme activation domain-containing protein [Acidimicrobiales bacterium]
MSAVAALGLAAPAVLTTSTATAATARSALHAARQHLARRAASGLAERPVSERDGRAARRLVTVGAQLRLPAGSRQLGALAPATGVQFQVALRLGDAAGLAAYAAGVGTQSSPYYHRYLTPAELTAAFGPTPAESRAVVQALRAAGLSAGTVPANRLLITASGSAGQVATALHLSFERLALPDGQRGWSAVGAPRLPEAVAGSIEAVVGLDHLDPSLGSTTRTAIPGMSALTGAQAPGASGASGASGLTPGGASGAAPVAVATADRRQVSIAGATATDRDLPRACAKATDTAALSGGWTDDAVANAYGFAPLLDSGDLGQGETIALWEADQFSMQDIATFERCYFGRSRTSRIKVIPLDGYDMTGPNIEATLDIEQIATLAPDARILVYEDNPVDETNFVEYETIITEDRANIVSMSYGGCEPLEARTDPAYLEVENSLFEEAAAEGITWISSSGDSGADTCAEEGTMPAPPDRSSDDPAGQPFVLGVGGVSLKSDTTPPEETAWNDGVAGGGGGGGISSVWPSPAWQADSGVPGTRAGGRQIPDVSALGDPQRGVVEYSSAFSILSKTGNGGIPIPKNWSLIGGTSVAAPQWAAALAIVADSPRCSSLPRTAGGPDLGFVSPALYEIAARPSTYAASFTQVIAGNDDNYGTGLGYSAHPGYNEVSGLGTPLLAGPAGQAGLAADLCTLATGHGLAAGGPIVTSLSPASGSVAGGTAVTISGSGFTSTAGRLQVMFGTSPATVVSVSPTSIVVDTPPAPVVARAASYTEPTTVDVTVSERTRGEVVTSFPAVPAQYGYLEPGPTASGAPTVAAVDPDGGGTGAGKVVTIYGSGFSNGGVTPTVTFGGVAATG